MSSLDDDAHQVDREHRRLDDEWLDAAANDDAETFAVLLLPGWRHPNTGKVHIRRECRAVEFHQGRMQPIMVRLDDEREVGRVLGERNLCGYCFAGF